MLRPCPIAAIATEDLKDDSAEDAYVHVQLHTGFAFRFRDFFGKKVLSLSLFLFLCGDVTG